jgi:sugar (pentulose or hexulose) kinase
VIPSPVRADDDLVIQPLLTGNVTWDWVWRELLGAASAAAAAKSLWRSGVLPSPGLTALPWLNMPHPWLPGVHGGGILSGISPTTTRRDLARAMASGMAHELRRVLSEVLPRCETAVLTGGAARAAGWQQLAALALGVPTRPAESPMEASLVGCRGAVAAIAPAAGAFRPGAPIRTSLRDRQAFGEQHAEYCTSFERLAGDVPAGGRFRFVEDKR